MKQKFVIYSGEIKIYEKFVMAVNPGEMQTITINKALVKDDLKINIE